MSERIPGADGAFKLDSATVSGAGADTSLQAESAGILLETRDLTKYFGGKKRLFEAAPRIVKAVDGVDISIRKGETLGLVGESGCGKSTLGRTILGLLPKTSGSVFFAGREISDLPRKEARQLKQRMQIVFQDPYGSLNPRMTVLDLVRAPLDVFGIGTKAEKEERVAAMLRQVGMGAHQLNRYPHEFSGGQRQRIGIARALILQPEFVVCDEPVSALDVSVRAQVLNLMAGLQKELGLTYLFISHDLSVVKHISDRVAVMYLGRIVEITGKRELYAKPLHPYTQALLSAIPKPSAQAKQQRNRCALKGDVPSSYAMPPGCRFHPRCPKAIELCSREVPLLRGLGPDHQVACHLA
jgi:peptide/nickel transport system ATP-binding protein/oligopeptide transport system ATP-binding protein